MLNAYDEDLANHAVQAVNRGQKMTYTTEDKTDKIALWLQVYMHSRIADEPDKTVVVVFHLRS